MNAIAQKLANDRAGARVTFRAFGSPTLREYFSYIPDGAGPASPIMVLVHGITRRAAEQAFRFRGEADRTGTILIAPHFPKIIYGQYQQVIGRNLVRTDVALIEIIDDLFAIIGGHARPVHLFGFSGGAQFAHRFAMIHPDRVASLNLASAGWYTMPDGGLPYPYGMGTHPVPGRSFDIESFLTIERHVFVGGEDRLQDDALRTSQRLSRIQGKDRVERAARWVEAMNDASRRYGAYPPRSSFEVLKGVGHSFAGSARRRSLPARVMKKLEIGPQGKGLP